MYINMYIFNIKDISLKFLGDNKASKNINRHLLRFTSYLELH